MAKKTSSALSTTAPPNELESRSTGKSRILLVDDLPIVREGPMARLNAEPDLVVCGSAADAHEALRLVEECAPDLVITDLSLSGRPGLELIKDLEKQHAAVPVLVGAPVASIRPCIRLSWS